MSQIVPSLRPYDSRMKRKALASVVTVLLISAISGTGAQAATKVIAGGLCTKAASTTKISGKSYTCTKVLSGKLVWVATTATGAKPQVTGSTRGEGAGDDGGRIKTPRTSKSGKTVAPSHEAEGADN